MCVSWYSNFCESFKKPYLLMSLFIQALLSQAFSFVKCLSWLLSMVSYSQGKYMPLNAFNKLSLEVLPALWLLQGKTKTSLCADPSGSHQTGDYNSSRIRSVLSPLSLAICSTSGLHWFGGSRMASRQFQMVQYSLSAMQRTHH